MDTFSEITACISEEMDRFHVTFEQMLRTKIPLADNIIRYFLDRKGKQLRPVMAILAAKMINDKVSDTTILGAVALELLHNASLMHDDVVDDLFLEAKKDVIRLILTNPSEGEEATDILMIAKYFERIGDHATNIAEWVIFSIDDHVNEKA